MHTYRHLFNESLTNLLKGKFWRIAYNWSNSSNFHHQLFTLHGTCRISCRYVTTEYGKTFEGENLRGFLANREVFPLNHLPCTVHNGMGLMHHESFPENSVFCAQPWKFPPSKVLPYTVLCMWILCLVILTAKVRVLVGCTYCEQAKLVTCLATYMYIHVCMTTYIHICS